MCKAFSRTKQNKKRKRKGKGKEKGMGKNARYPVGIYAFGLGSKYGEYTDNYGARNWVLIRYPK